MTDHQSNDDDNGPTVLPPRMMLLFFLFLILAIVVLAIQPFGRMQTRDSSSPPPIETDIAPERMQTQVTEFCGSCHKVPLPEHLPRRSWAEEIGKAYRRLEQSGKTNLTVPDQQQMIAYFTTLAPAQMVIPDAPESDIGPITFDQEFLELPPTTRTAAISYLTVETSKRQDGTPQAELLSCNMEGGEVERLIHQERSWTITRLATLRNPDHLMICDYDKDGIQDYLIADLGTLNATDDLLGRVTLLQGTAQRDKYRAVTVKQGLGRVADARAADLDGDGDDDFVVAEFGFEKSGRLLWLETTGTRANEVDSKLHVIDARHGSIHTPPIDLDGDGDLDLVTLFSQESESIVAFFNDGKGAFTPRVLFEADTPAFGSSGLELADLDGDGDQDLLFTNGDTLDKFQLRPFHGVHWLENKGANQFEYHHLTNLPGAVKAIACDLDGDQDLDIAAVAYCPPELRGQARPKRFDTLIWLEQTASGQFQRHSLNQSGDGHMAITVADWNQDGRPDLAVGEASFDPGQRRWLTIYWNRGGRNSVKSVSTALDP